MIALSPPTRRGYVSSTWGADRSYRGGWHEGLDFPGAIGEPVLAAADGTVVRVDNANDSFAGRWIAIDHGGVVSRYLHNTANQVRVGQQVRRGQQIATLGTSGTTTAAPHVHFDVKISATKLAEYIASFGRPSTGFGDKTSLGYGVPAEPLVQGATYRPEAKTAAEKLGVRFRSTPWLLYAAIAVAGYWVIDRAAG